MKKKNIISFCLSATISFLTLLVGAFFVFKSNQIEPSLSVSSFLGKEPERIYIKLFEEKEKNTAPLSFFLSKNRIFSSQGREITLPYYKKQKAEKLFETLSSAKIQKTDAKPKNETSSSQIRFEGSKGKRLELFEKTSKGKAYFSSSIDSSSFFSSEITSALKRENIFSLFPSLFESLDGENGNILSLKVLSLGKGNLRIGKSGKLYSVETEKQSYLCHEKELYLSLKNGLNKFKFLCPFDGDFLLSKKYSALNFQKPDAILDLTIDVLGEAKLKTVKFYFLKSEHTLLAVTENSSVYSLDLKTPFSIKLPKPFSFSLIKSDFIFNNSEKENSQTNNSSLSSITLKSKGVAKEISFKPLENDQKKKKIFLNNSEIRTQDIFGIIDSVSEIKPTEEVFISNPEDYKLKIKISFNFENGENGFVNFYELDENNEILYFGSEDETTKPSNALVTKIGTAEKLLKEFEKL